METTRLSSKGQVIIPKSVRDAHQWDSGLELQVIEMGDGILLKPKAPFDTTTLDEVAGCLTFKGVAKTQEEVNAAMKKAAREAWRGGN